MSKMASQPNVAKFFKELAEKSLPNTNWDIVSRKIKGSPGFEPSRVQAELVRRLRALGHSSSDIAKLLNIDRKVLEAYYSYELKTGRLHSTTAVANVALEMALSGDSENMTKFWLKTQGGWKETEIIEHEGIDAEADAAKAAREKLLAED